MFTAPATVTTANAHTVLAEGLQAIAGGQLEFDFAATRQADSAAVAMLLSWQRAAQNSGVQLQLRNLPDSLQSLARLYDVAALLLPEAAPATQASAPSTPATPSAASAAPAAHHQPHH
ncbi:MAG: hypothetical protein RL748_2568 [Pseudomonadota bacterium]|jgi:phospholipid transport system transporter-binding protein